jgi:hypothetical protein
MLSYALVDAFTHVDPDEAVVRLGRAVALVEGVIVDFAFFSNRAIRMTVEMASGAMPLLREALEAGEVHVFARCADTLDRTAARPSSTKPVLAMLHVAFSDDDLVPLAG